jgi:hypothetical protein
MTHPSLIRWKIGKPSLHVADVPKFPPTIKMLTLYQPLNTNALVRSAAVW